MIKYNNNILDINNIDINILINNINNILNNNIYNINTNLTKTKLIILTPNYFLNNLGITHSLFNYLKISKNKKHNQIYEVLINAIDTILANIYQLQLLDPKHVGAYSLIINNWLAFTHHNKIHNELERESISVVIKKEKGLNYD